MAAADIATVCIMIGYACWAVCIVVEVLKPKLEDKEHERKSRK